MLSWMLAVHGVPNKMDRGTRIYAYLLLALALVLAFAIFYQPEQVRTLNRKLADDPELSRYPYPFRVLRVRGTTAEMSSPRSASMPVERVIGAIYPGLENMPVTDPAYQHAQQDLAEHQGRAKRLVLSEPGINAVQWQLDESWLARQGVQLPY